MSLRGVFLKYRVSGPDVLPKGSWLTSPFGLGSRSDTSTSRDNDPPRLANNTYLGTLLVHVEQPRTYIKREMKNGLSAGDTLRSLSVSAHIRAYNKCTDGDTDF